MTIEATVCWACVVGLHEECLDLQPASSEGYFTCCCGGQDSSEDSDKVRTGEIGRPMMETHEIVDVLSTGRKRAAMLYPIHEGMLCEWAGLKNAGGGVVPIQGCDNHKLTSTKGGKDGLHQGDVHHGPDKNTLENSPGNVHRICATCHHRWHAANDKFYGPRPKKDDGKVDGTKPFLPLPEYELLQHDPVTQANSEIFEEELDIASEFGNLIEVDLD